MPFWWRLAGPMFRRLKQQLALGGRLVIPVGSERREQKLLKISRRSETEFEQEDLGEVLFVPLIGQQGWAEDGRRAASNHVPGRSRGRTLPEMIAGAAEPLPDFLDPAFGQLFDRFAARRVVLLGEASHGTSEFYRGRAAITRHLIEKHGFTIVAVEADWPDAAAVDRYVRHRTTDRSSDKPFERLRGTEHWATLPSTLWQRCSTDRLWHPYWHGGRGDGLGW
jgi:hypothetical protein